MRHLWEELITYSESDYYPFHMPGHKRFTKEDALDCCKSFPEENVVSHCRQPITMEDICKYDITEIEGFDNLHDAKDLLLELQQKATCIYRAEQSFFLINGSTGGILSAVSAVAREGKNLLIARNCHRSVYNGVFLNRLKAEYLWPEMIEEFDIQGEITAEQVRKHLTGRRDICGVVVTSPTYDGIISDIRGIAEAVHACSLPLIVDEAHGAHFVLSKRAPESAVECGADIVINSLHKTLPAPTQTALLHVQGALVDREKLKSYLGIYQSSSPSYLLMAGIDHCLDYIVDRGQEGYETLKRLRGQIDDRAEKLCHIKILPAGKRRDLGKLVISVKGTRMTGQELYQVLLERYHLQMEMSTASYVLGILTGMDTEYGVGRLMDALEEIDRELCQNGIKDKAIKKSERADDIYNIVPAVSGWSIYSVMQNQREWLLPEESVGRISGGFLYLYPPGIPFIVPGEIISEEVVLGIEQVKNKGKYLTGISKEGKLCVVV